MLLYDALMTMMMMAMIDILIRMMMEMMTRNLSTLAAIRFADVEEVDPAVESKAHLSIRLVMMTMFINMMIDMMITTMTVIMMITTMTIMMMITI